MDDPTLRLFLRQILTVTSVWNTGETDDIYTLILSECMYGLLSFQIFIYLKNGRTSRYISTKNLRNSFFSHIGKLGQQKQIRGSKTLIEVTHNNSYFKI